MFAIRLTGGMGQDDEVVPPLHVAGERVALHNACRKQSWQVCRLLGEDVGMYQMVDTRLARSRRSPGFVYDV